MRMRGHRRRSGVKSIGRKAGRPAATMDVTTPMHSASPSSTAQTCWDCSDIARRCCEAPCGSPSLALTRALDCGQHMGAISACFVGPCCSVSVRADATPVSAAR